MLHGMPITMLNGTHGLGCSCQSVPAFSGVAAYDFITIGGKQYSAGQLVGKDLLVTNDVYLYQGLSHDNGKILVKAGQSAGKVYSYLQPGGTNTTGKVVLGIDRVRPDTGAPWIYWLKDDNAISQSALKDQGTLTVEQQVKQEQEEQQKENSPIEYYVSKYATKVLLIGVGAYAAVEIGKQLIKSKASKTLQTA